MSKLTWLSILFIAAVAVVVIAARSCTYVLDQRDAAIVTLFGTVKEVATEPGLHFKNPLADVTTYRLWIQEYNKEPSNTVTADKKNILVGFFVKYRISDVLKYAQTVQTKAEAEKRIDDVVYSALKTNVSRASFDDVVVSRGVIERATLEASHKQAAQFGIELVDFRIKTTDLPPQILDSVYARMTEERRQKAQMDRSEGEKLKQIMIAEADKRQTQILSEAYREKQKLMGEGDREALRVLTEAYGKDVEFAMFVKTLDLYRESLRKEDTRIILSTKSELLKYFAGTRALK